MNLPHGVDGPAHLLAIALVGRVLLALLPPGLPGRHAPAELAATWAASHLLGTFALSVEAGIFEVLGLSPPVALFLAPWVLLALGRWLTLPGAMVPRQELPREKATPLALVLHGLAALLVLAAALKIGTGGTVAADGLAILALASHALATARRAQASRALAACVLGAALAGAIAWLRVPSLALPLSIGGGAALSIPWLRRADRRAGALAVLAFAGAATLGPREALFGAAGIAALWIHTAAPSRSALAILALAAFVPAALLGWRVRAPDLEAASVLSPLGAATFVVVAFALSSRQRLLLARGSDAADPGRLGSSMLRDALILSILPPISRGEIGSLEVLAAALLPVVPILAVETGILLGRVEPAPR